MKKSLIIIILTIVSVTSIQVLHAEKVYKLTRILRVETYNPSYATSYANYVVLKLDANSYFGESTCNKEWVAVGPTSEAFFDHMYTAILTAYSTKQSAYVKVDDQVKVSGSTCLLTDFYLNDE